MKIHIGTGGWSHFRIRGKDPLGAYAEAFDYVEVNSTFYNYPKTKAVESWRQRVPENFEFSVKCHRDLSHEHRMEPVEGSFRCIDRMKDVCRILKARILLIQTPSDLRIDDTKIVRINELLGSIDLRGIRLAWEIRGNRQKVPRKLFELMQDSGIVHSTDLSRELPAYSSDVLYTRLFGKGAHNVYQFIDEELVEIVNRVAKQDAEHVYYNIHGVRMYKDAARLKNYSQTGRFPMVTSTTGLDSLGEVLNEDARFPCRRDDLIKKQGWKVIDLTSEKRVRAKDLLEKLPDRLYKNVDGIIGTLRKGVG